VYTTSATVPPRPPPPSSRTSVSYALAGVEGVLMYFIAAHLAVRLRRPCSSRTTAEALLDNTTFNGTSGLLRRAAARPGLLPRPAAGSDEPWDPLVTARSAWTRLSLKGESAAAVLPRREERRRTPLVESVGETPRCARRDQRHHQPGAVRHARAPQGRVTRAEPNRSRRS